MTRPDDMGGSTDDQSTPFRQVVDDLTNGCGCACHTGTGYRTSCVHCVTVRPPMTTEGTTPSLDLPERYERLSKAFDALSATLRHTETWARDEQKKRHDVEDKLVAERSTVAALEQRLAEATEQLRRQGEVVEAARRIGGLLQGYRWSEKSDNSMLTAMQEHYDAIRALEAAVPAAPNAAELASIAAGKADIAAGRFKVFDSVEALIDDLNTPSADREAEGAS